MWCCTTRSNVKQDMQLRQKKKRSERAGTEPLNSFTSDLTSSCATGYKRWRRTGSVGSSQCPPRQLKGGGGTKIFCNKQTASRKERSIV